MGFIIFFAIRTYLRGATPSALVLWPGLEGEILSDVICCNCARYVAACSSARLMWKTSDTLFFPSWVKTMQKSTTDSHAKCHLSASEKVRKPLLGANKQKYGQPHES